MIIPEHNYTQREQTVCEILKDLEIKSFINIGFHNWEDPRRHWWIKICDANSVSWKIVEVFESNVLDAIKKGCPEDKIFNLNIKDVDNLPDSDCLMFWHGPEHLLKEEFLEILPKLEKKYKKLIFGMPWGEEPQGAAYGNPFEKHISAWDVEEWEDLGYTVVKVVNKAKYPHITCYKI
jgi:hypothetical protein